MSFFNKISTFFKENVQKKILKILSGKKSINQTEKEGLENLLMDQDFSPVFIHEFIEEIKQNNVEMNDQNIRTLLYKKMCQRIKPRELNFFENLKDQKKHIIFFTGVNGVGKTNTLGKFANMLREKKEKYLSFSADSFRAAAMEQLEQLCEQNKLSCQRFGIAGDKPSTIVYRAINTIKDSDLDFFLVDLSGINHERKDLFKEIEKTINITKKQIPQWHIHIFLVLDSTMGNSLLKQIENFSEYVQVTGLIFTKMDSIMRNGALVTVAEKFSTPFVFFTAGESIEDIYIFSTEALVNSLI